MSVSSTFDVLYLLATPFHLCCRNRLDYWRVLVCYACLCLFSRSPNIVLSTRRLSSVRAREWRCTRVRSRTATVAARTRENSLSENNAHKVRFLCLRAVHFSPKLSGATESERVIQLLTAFMFSVGGPCSFLYIRVSRTQVSYGGIVRHSVPLPRSHVCVRAERATYILFACAYGREPPCFSLERSLRPLYPILPRFARSCFDDTLFLAAFLL